MVPVTPVFLYLWLLEDMETANRVGWIGVVLLLCLIALVIAGSIYNRRHPRDPNAQPVQQEKPRKVIPSGSRGRHSPRWVPPRAGSNVRSGSPAAVSQS